MASCHLVIRHLTQSTLLKQRDDTTSPTTEATRNDKRKVIRRLLLLALLPTGPNRAEAVRVAGWLAGWLAAGWLLPLAGWLADWLASWLPGWWLAAACLHSRGERQLRLAGNSTEADSSRPGADVAEASSSQQQQAGWLRQADTATKRLRSEPSADTSHTAGTPHRTHQL